jgi:tRNA dimethylallyltransferase
VRARWERLYDEEGAAAAHAELAERDPGAAAAVHPNDRRRVVRALELTEAGSSLRPERDRLWAEETRVPSLVFGLDIPKGVLEKRIVARTRAMFDQGVEAEVAAALQHRLSSTAAKVMGLREIAELPRDDALAALVLRTRRYAAYQRKWMRRVPGIIMIEANRPPAEVADAVLEVARARQLVPARRAG